MIEMIKTNQFAGFGSNLLSFFLFLNESFSSGSTVDRVLFVERWFHLQ